MKKSPFPGMDPWLESRWNDVHSRLTLYASDQLQPHLPTGLHAHVEEYVALAGPDVGPERLQRFETDVRVVEHGKDLAIERGAVTASETMTQPLIVPRQHEPETLRYIRIVDCNSKERVVTTIEFLSRANKVTRAGRNQFRGKQRKLIAAGVNVVEVDLLRSGKWVISVDRGLLAPEYRQPYRVCVVRATDADQAEVYSIPVQRPLPSIRIPLRSEDQDVALNLQSILETAYANGRYGEILDYDINPQPPLSDNDAKWIDLRLEQQGIR